MSQQLWDMSADKIRATEPTDMKFTFLKGQFKDLSENVHFYPSLIYSCWVMPLSSERCHDTSKSSVPPLNTRTVLKLALGLDLQFFRAFRVVLLWISSLYLLRVNLSYSGFPPIRNPLVQETDLDFHMIMNKTMDKTIGYCSKTIGCTRKSGSYSREPAVVKNLPRKIILYFSAFCGS